MTQSAHLSDRGVLMVSGEDARTFLQGLITNDIHKASPPQAVFAAMLSPQGKFLYDFFIIEHDGQLLFDTDKARLPDLIKRLSMYKLRAKVELAPLPDLQVSAVWGGQVSAGIHYADPRHPALGSRVIGAATETTGDYDAHRLSLGIPEGSKDLVFDRSLPLEFGYDELGTIDFGKGCYVGQEVTARTKHRATLRKFIFQVAGQNLPPSGTAILAGAREVGILTSSHKGAGLAHLRVEDAEGAALTCGGIAITAKLPGWCKTSFERG